MDVTFLYAPQRLVKVIALLANGEIRKSAYPHAKNFTSETVEVNNLLELYKQISTRATDPRKPCLLKGHLNRPLIGESRRNSTSTNDKTQFLVLDPDEAPFSSPDELMRALNLGDVSYIVQYSSSYKLSKSRRLSAHIFIMLDRPVAAPALKSWLMQKNLEVPALKNALTLSNSQCALKWSLDITSCQNDRLIYTAEPDFHGMKPPVKASERILYVKKERDRLDISRMSEKALDVLKKEAREEMNRLRAAIGLAPLTRKPRMQGEFAVQHGVNEIGAWEVVDDDGEFVRLNLNGGDSAAYWHYKDDFELLHNFKGEDSVKLKEILPEYYRELVDNKKEKQREFKAKQAKANESLSEEGDQLLCFRDKRTATYWNGTYNPGTNRLDLFPARNETQCKHFLLSYDQAPGDFIPTWERVFNPQSDKVVDFDKHTVNMWSPSEYLRNAKTVKEPTLTKCPTISRIIEWAVGTGPIKEHFLNWLAVIIQHRMKPRTAWVLHGTQGTGKGLIINSIIKPILGEQYVVTRMQNELKSDFSSFIEFAMVAFIDEIEVDSLETGGLLESKLKFYITEPIVPIRRMRTDSYSVPSYTGWIFGSNKPQPVVIPRNDRRYNVGQFQKTPLVISREEVEVKIPQELQAFTDYMLSRNANVDTASKPLLTEDRETLMALSETSVERTANALLNGDLEIIWEAMPNEELIEALHHSSSHAMAAQAYIGFVKRATEDAYYKRETKIGRDELGVIFQHCVGNCPSSANKLTKYLSHHNIVTKRIRLDNGLNTYGIEVAWKVSDAFLKDVYTPPKPQPRARGLRVVNGKK